MYSKQSSEKIYILDAVGKLDIQYYQIPRFSHCIRYYQILAQLIQPGGNEVLSSTRDAFLHGKKNYIIYFVRSVQH